MFYSGADPVTLLDDLRELGQAHITAHADQVPPLPSLEAEHCYLWWEILLVTDRDRGRDQGRVRLRRGRMRSAHPAAGGPSRGCGPAWFRAGGGVRTVRGWSAKTTWSELKRDALALEKRSGGRGTTSTLSFGASTASRAMPVCCWETSKAPPSSTVIRCNCCSGWPTGWSPFSIRSAE